MDRSWIYGRLFTPAYIDGVKQFMKFIAERFNENAEILCPCHKCLNQKRMHQGRVEDHIYINGISSTYTQWIHHGEPLDVEVVENTDQGNENADYLHHDNLDEIDDEEEDDEDRIPDMLHDIYTSAEQGRHDGGSESLFASLLKEASRELYPGSVNFSRFSFVVKLLHIKSYYRITNTAFGAILKLLCAAFPACQSLPRSYNEAKNYLREIGLGYDTIHVCKNNCVLFHKQYAKLDECPVCGESRWQDQNGTKKVAHKVLRHFPLIPRLKRLFVSKQTAEDTQWHHLKRMPVEKELSHPADGEAWKDFDRIYPEFAKDARNLRLGIATDGFNPFGNMSTSYSMWPVFVVPYNLPPWACMDQSNFKMALLIPGPNCPGKDFGLFLEPLVEELLELWKGVCTFDAFGCEMFDLHAAVLWCIHDYPALSTMSGRTTRGYSACLHCDKNPLSFALRSKICYIGHRRFLPMGHRWRRSTVFDGKHEMREKPGKFSKAELEAELEKVRNVRPGKHPLSKKRKRGEPTPIWGRRICLWDLPYWINLKLRHNLDVMHIEKNICDSIIGTVMNIDGKTKDTIKARLDLHDLKIRKELHLKDKDTTYEKPVARYALTKEQKIAFCQFLLAVRFPDGYASNIGRCISSDGCKVHGLKTHDCHILLQRILPAGMRGFLEKDIYEAIAELGKFFRELCSKTLNLDVLQRLKEEIPIILCKLERIFPPAFFDVMVHLAVHLPEEAMLRGPVQYGWMYPIERLLCTLKRYVRNKARPEGSIAEAYIAEECLTFCSRYMDDLETRFNREPRNVGFSDESSVEVDIFSHGVNLLGKSNLVYVHHEIDKMIWYVLNNCTEVQKYIDMFKEKLKNEGVIDVDKQVQKGFEKWFRSHIVRLRGEKSEEASDDLFALACGPLLRVRSYSSCVVNGVRFNTLEREKNRKTQNSGVMVEGTHDGQHVDFYGTVNEIIELQYNSDEKVTRTVVLFRCKWFDIGMKKKDASARIKDDGLFKSINISGFWYKNEPFILATQAVKVFYLPDTLYGKNWRVVQKFDHRHMFDVSEIDANMPNVPAYQEEDCSDEETAVKDTDLPSIHLCRTNVQAESLDADVVLRNMNDKDDPLLEIDSEDEEDETMMEYCDVAAGPIVQIGFGDSDDK